MKKLILLIMLLVSYGINAEPYNLPTPTQREDDTALGLSEIKGYNMYCGDVVGDYTTDVFFNVQSKLPITTIDITTLPNGTSYCVFTTVDIDLRESNFTPVVEFVNNGKAIPKPPAVPIDQTIIFNTTLP